MAYVICFYVSTCLVDYVYVDYVFMLQIVAKMSARLGAALGEVPDINSADRSHQHHTRVRRREEERGTHAVYGVC